MVCGCRPGAIDTWTVRGWINKDVGKNASTLIRKRNKKEKTRVRGSWCAVPRGEDLTHMAVYGDVSDSGPCSVLRDERDLDPKARMHWEGVIEIEERNQRAAIFHNEVLVVVLARQRAIGSDVLKRLIAMEAQRGRCCESFISRAWLTHWLVFHHREGSRR